MVFLVFVHLPILLVLPSTLPLCLSKVFRQTIPSLHTCSLPSCPWCSFVFFLSIHLPILLVLPSTLPAYLRYFVRKYFPSIYLSCQSFPPHFLSAYLRFLQTIFFRPSTYIAPVVSVVPSTLSRAYLGISSENTPVVSVVFLVFPSILSILLVFHVRLPICLSKVFLQTIFPSCPW